jgi:hypothetical protein
MLFVKSTIHHNEFSGECKYAVALCNRNGYASIAKFRDSEGNKITYDLLKENKIINGYIEVNVLWSRGDSSLVSLPDGLSGLIPKNKLLIKHW